MRVAVSPAAQPGQWKIDVACRDTDGLLAHLTDVLTERGLDIVGATISSWPDGAVLDSFVVVSRDRPGAKALALEFEASLTRNLSRNVSPVAMPTLEIAFDNSAHPWYTSVTVTGPDLPGALLAVSTAFVAADATVHTARIATLDQLVNDRFTVSDRLGRKLDQRTMNRIRLALTEGRTSRRFRRPR